jgi:hypothetical protein
MIDLIRRGQTSVYGQFSDVKIKGLTANNIVKNGNFTDAINWTGVNGTLNITDNTAIITGDGSSSVIGIRQDFNLVMSATNFFIKFKIKVPDGCTKITFVSYHSTDGSISITKDSPTTGIWLDFSAIANIGSIGYVRINTYFDSADAAEDKVIEIKEVMLINVTQTFGSGNEPTKEQCDQIFTNWFDGTKSTNSVRIRSVNEDETKESIVYVNLPQGEELRSLPNGTKDEVNVVEGKLTKRVSDEYTINSDLIQQVLNRYYLEKATSFRLVLNIDNTVPSATTFSNDNAYIVQKGIKISPQSGWGPEVIHWDKDFPQYYIQSELYNGRMRLLVSLPHTMTGWEGDPTEQQVRDYFNANPATLTYQLATPITTYIDPQPLQIFPNGSRWLEHANKEVAIYNTGIHVTNTDLPIKEMIKVDKIGLQNGRWYREPVDLADVTVAPDGLSFTIDGATSGPYEQYEFEYHYDSALSTLPELVIPSEPSLVTIKNRNISL